MSEEQSSGALQLAAQVNFRLDKGQACAEAYDQLKAAGQVNEYCGLFDLNLIMAFCGDMSVMFVF